MKSKFFAVRSFALFAAVFVLIVVLLSFPRNRGECSRSLYQKLGSRGVTDTMLMEFADSVEEECKRKRYPAIVYITPAMQVRNVGPILAAFDREKDLFDVAALKINGEEWIITISLFRTSVWEREGMIVIKPTATSREAFNGFISQFSGRKDYAENIVGTCMPPKM